METPKHEIRINIDPWVAEYEATEPDVRNHDAIIGRCLEGVPTAKVGQYTLVAREKGDAPDDILPPNDHLLLSGARGAVQSIFAQRKIERETEDGRRYTVREFVSLYGREQAEAAQKIADNAEMAAVASGIVKSSDKRAAYLAEDYLLETMPAHIASRFAILKELDEDVRAVGGELIKRIQELIERYA